MRNIGKINNGMITRKIIIEGRKTEKCARRGRQEIKRGKRSKIYHVQTGGRILEAKMPGNKYFRSAREGRI
jgi:hypothetical protein